MTRPTAWVAGEASRPTLAATAARRACQLAGIGAGTKGAVRLVVPVAVAVPTAADAGEMDPSMRMRPVPTVTDQRVHFFKN
jgi:hypothetical protein